MAPERRISLRLNGVNIPLEPSSTPYEITVPSIQPQSHINSNPEVDGAVRITSTNQHQTGDAFRVLNFEAEAPQRRISLRVNGVLIPLNGSNPTYEITIPSAQHQIPQIEDKSRVLNSDTDSPAEIATRDQHQIEGISPVPETENNGTDQSISRIQQHIEDTAPKATLEVDGSGRAFPLSQHHMGDTSPIPTPQVDNSGETDSSNRSLLSTINEASFDSADQQELQAEIADHSEHPRVMTDGGNDEDDSCPACLEASTPNATETQEPLEQIPSPNKNKHLMPNRDDEAYSCKVCPSIIDVTQQEETQLEMVSLSENRNLPIDRKYGDGSCTACPDVVTTDSIEQWESQVEIETPSEDLRSMVNRDYVDDSCPTCLDAIGSDGLEPNAQEPRAQLAVAMTNTSILINYHVSHDLDSPDLDTFQQSDILEDLQKKIKEEKDPRRQKVMTKEYRQKLKAEEKKAKREQSIARRAYEQAEKEKEKEKLMARELHDQTAENCEDICHPELSGTPNTDASPFRMVTYQDMLSCKRSRIQTLDNSPSNFFIQIREPPFSGKKIKLFVGSNRGPVVAEAKNGPGYSSRITLDCSQKAQAEKRKPQWILLKMVSASLAKYNFALPFGSVEGGVSTYEIGKRVFIWERVNYNSVLFAIEFELREPCQGNNSGEGEVLAMLTYKGGVFHGKGKGKITMKRGFGRDIERNGAERLIGWTDWEVMVMMSGLCIIEAYKTWEMRQRVYGS